MIGLNRSPLFYHPYLGHQINALNHQYRVLALIAIVYDQRLKFAIIVSTLLSIL